MAFYKMHRSKETNLKISSALMGNKNGCGRGKYQRNPIIKFCKCGCKTKLTLNCRAKFYSSTGKPIEYVHGHNRRNVTYRMSELAKQKFMLNRNKSHTKETRTKLSIIGKNNWNNSEYVQKTLSALKRKPTRLEKDVSNLLVDLFRNEWKYVGNSSFLIGTKNPDFVVENKRLCMEVFHEYHKIRNYVSVDNYITQRQAYFKSYGWNCVFISYTEFYNNQPLVIEKITKSMEVY